MAAPPRPKLPAGNALAGTLLGNLLRGKGGGGGGSGKPPPAAAPKGKVTTPVNTKTGGQVTAAFNPNSNFGLDVNSKAAFDPLNPGRLTVGGFNKEVLAAAQPGYLPQLQQIQGQQSAENRATAQRTQDVGAIYDQYRKQAQSAYNQVQTALANLAAQTNAGSGQANLSAALGSALGGQNQLAQMMGLNAPSTQTETLPYTGAAQAASTATEKDLNSAGAGAIGLQGENLSNVGNERATELNTESLRHQGAMTALQQSQADLAKQIPGIIQKAREQLIQDLQSAESLRFQQGLASQQFGLQSQAQAFNQAQTKAQFAETQKNDAANRAAQAAATAQNAQRLRNEETNTAVAAQQAIAKAQGQSQVNAIKDVQAWLQPPKTATKQVTTTDASGTKRTQTILVNPKAIHHDVGTELRSIMSLYGLNMDQALTILEEVGGDTPVSGQGGQTVAQWAYTFRQRNMPLTKSAAGSVKGIGNVVSGGVKRIAGNPFK